ncbi:hypothetical protein AVEN_48935-1 [Araneus ventricosus]|uniref:Uncharacterized protein n=1 Tax=Araneus ventricosus TaxID=182803 RepID=A0A4Y2AGI8_ARAVE|nr:hypothetical protein AVEN_48935-1 [Araneus ventricosus]
MAEWYGFCLGDGGFQVQKPIPLNTCRVLGLLPVKSYGGVQTSSRWCGAKISTLAPPTQEGCKAWCTSMWRTGLIRQHEGCFGESLIILNRGRMARTTPELAPFLSPSLRTTSAGGRLVTTYGLACSRLHAPNIFSGIGFRDWSPPAAKPRPCHLATGAFSYF